MKNNDMPNGHFKKSIFNFGLCFSWVITVFLLCLGDGFNPMHASIATYSFISGMACVFGLAFKQQFKINTPWLKTDDEKNTHDDEHNKKSSQ
jgi:ABC-type uncharacterized transport system permease subunit